jgi:hypothetical protein
MGKYRQTPLQMARSIFAHAEIFNGQEEPAEAKLPGCPDKPENRPVFDSRKAPPQL